MRLTSALLVLLALFAAPTLRAETAALPLKPFLLHLNGVGGTRSIDQTLIRGLRQAGFDGDVRIYDWTGGRIGIEALQGRERHESEARKIADMILARHRDSPNAPIHLTAHSGGAGLAVWALELLPEDVKVQSVFLIAPALSPKYDLTKALTHVTGRLYVFSSPHDSIVLAAGCRLFGTIDGVKCEAAGVEGFVKPDTADEEQYRKLVPLPYQKTWLRAYGNAGSHICAMRYRFARDFIGPLFLTGMPPERQEPGAEPAAASP